MRTWIFQGNPELFDIDGYLAASLGTILWRTAQYSSEISPGDRVYLWRSQGGAKSEAGIVAEGTILEPPRLQRDEPWGRKFWKHPQADEPILQVLIRLNRIAAKKEMLKRDWMKDDSALENMLILRRPAGTNFPVTPTEEHRLGQLWRKTGSDWARDEVVGAMHLYEKLQGKPISKIAGSEVEKLSQQLGRAPTGVYNKLMNLRSLDPRTNLQGMDATSATDRSVWKEFFDNGSNTVRLNSLEAEFMRLWGAGVVSDKNASLVLQKEEERLNEKPVAELLEIYAKRPKNKRPQRTSQSVFVYDRDPLIVALRKKLANHKCEVAGCTSPTFESSSGDLFVEVHHIDHLAENGEDSLENTVALCPTHHRLLHYGKEREVLVVALKEMRKADAPGAKKPVIE